MASNFFPKRQWYLTPLLLLLLILVCGLQSCSKGSPLEPKSSGLAGSLWTEGTGTMLLDFVSDSEVRFTLTPSGSPRTMSYTTSYRLEGQTLYITDIYPYHTLRRSDPLEGLPRGNQLD